MILYIFVNVAGQCSQSGTCLVLRAYLAERLLLYRRFVEWVNDTVIFITKTNTTAPNNEINDSNNNNTTIIKITTTKLSIA